MIICVFSKDNLKCQIKEKIFETFAKFYCVSFLKSVKKAYCFVFNEGEMLTRLPKIHRSNEFLSELSSVFICSFVEKSLISE